MISQQTILRFYGHFVVLLAVVGLLNLAVAKNETEWMPDEHLRAAVREALGMAPDTSLTPQALEALTELYAAQQEISDLKGLEYAMRLETLELFESYVVDITPLAKLTKLEALDLKANGIVDVTPLSSLTGLKELDLRSNQVVDITPLAHLTKLEQLNLNNNEIRDVAPLSTLTRLEQLYLYGNKVVDITPLATLVGLKTLNLENNRVVDVAPLSTLTRLEQLYLENNQVVDVTPLVNLTGLRKLDITDNPIQDVTTLYTLRERNPNLSLRSPIPLPEPDLIPDGHLAEMVRLQLNLGRISPFTRETLQGLRKLRVYSQVTELTGLQHATQLEELYLSASGVSDITPLANLTKLKKLDLRWNQVVSLTPLANLTELEELYLSSNEISDIRPLVNLTKLKRLYLDANQIVDIQALANLTELELLILSNNRIRDITPLANLTGLEMLHLRTNQVNDSSVLAQLTDLKGLRIQANPIQDVTPLRTLLKNNSKMSIDVGFMGKFPCPLMYWIDMKRGTLHFRLDDPVVNLLPNIQNATTLALDGFEYYWTEKTDNNTWRIRRAVGRSGPWEVSYAEFTDTPMGMAIADRELYVSVASGKILRIPTNVGCYFAEPNFDFITGLASPEHLVVDTVGKNLYWTEKTPDGTWSIRSAPLDRSNVQSVTKLESAPLGLAIDAIAGQLYVSVASGKIQRLRVDGSDFQPDFITGLASPGSLGVDVRSNKVYWTEKDSIWRASLNGENAERVVTGLGMPAHLVLDVRLPTAGTR